MDPKPASYTDNPVAENPLLSSMLAHSDQTPLNFWTAAVDARLLIARKSVLGGSQEKLLLDDELDALRIALERMRMRRNQLVLANQLSEDVRLLVPQIGASA